MKGSLRRIGTLGFSLLALTLFSGEDANADRIDQYVIRGNVAAPILVDLNGNTRNPGNATFSLDFDSANVILSYHHGGAGLADDFMTIQGTLGGSITYDDPRYGQDQLSNYHFIVGDYDFDIDLLVTNPIASLTPDPGNRFAFGEQMAGTMTLLDAPFADRANWSATSTLAIKNDKNFAFNVFPDLNDPSKLVGEGWLVVMDGFLGIGNGSRWEFGDKNAFLNWDFSLERINNEVPEPFTAGLLSLGLLGGGLVRRRKNLA
jgi:hypothetical protein